MTTATQTLIQDYRRDGVITVKPLFSPERLEAIREALERFYVEIAPTLPATDVTFETDGKTVRNLWHLEKYDPFFGELAKDPDLLALVGELVNGEPVLMAVETFNKPAKVGTGVPAHQDNAYFCRTPADVLTVWLAVDPVTQANGPVFYIRGSQNQLLPHKPSGVSGNSMGLDADFDRSDPFVGTLDAGDALIHHCQTIHYSAPNTTDFPRCGLLMVFRGKHTEVDPKLKEAYRQGGAARD